MFLEISWDEAEDGEEAVLMVKTLGTKQCWRGYHLILMDLNMPVMGGIEATTKILTLKARQEASPFLEVIAVTAFVSEKEKRKMNESWYDRLYSKTIHYLWVCPLNLLI